MIPTATKYTDALYDAGVSYLDKRLAKFTGLERLWNGPITFTVDHGEILGDGNTGLLSPSDD